MTSEVLHIRDMWTEQPAIAHKWARHLRLVALNRLTAQSRGHKKRLTSSPEPVTKHTWNRTNIPFDSSPIIPRETIDAYRQEVVGLPTSKQPKAFLNKIYDDASYKRRLLRDGWGTKILRRGNAAVNWKVDGEWKCNSLKYINSVYQTMGKKEWSDNGKHGKQSASIHNQCGAFTKVGNTRCKRQCCSNSTFCTQHTNRYKQ